MRRSITLLQKVQTTLEGRYVDSVEFVESSFQDSPYNSMPSEEFSIRAIAANGGNPSQVFVASTDIDSVTASVERLSNFVKSAENE